MTWKSSRTNTASPSAACMASSLIRAVTNPCMDGAGASINGMSFAAMPGRARSKAAVAWRQNTAGSLSAASSDSQATDRRPRRIQSASSAVLPNPGGAQTRISPRSTPWSSHSTRRGRDMNPGGERGTNSFVASSPYGSTAPVSTVTPGSSLTRTATPGVEPACEAFRPSIVGLVSRPLAR